MLWKNGQPLTTDAFDRGLQFGDGHFTTLTIRHGQVRWWPLHWQRLSTASARLGIPLPPQSTVIAFLDTLKHDHPTSVVKLLFTAGESARGYGRPNELMPTWYATIGALPEVDSKPLKLELARLQLGEQPVLAGLKTLNRLEQVLLTQELATRTCDELVVTDQSGAMIETISSNLFWRTDSQWFTPHLGRAGICGIARTQLLHDGILDSIEEVRCGTEVLFAADQVFIVNSVLGPRSVAQFQNHTFDKQDLPEDVTAWWLSEMA